MADSDNDRAAEIFRLIQPITEGTLLIRFRIRTPATTARLRAPTRLTALASEQHKPWYYNNLRQRWRSA